MDSIMSFVTSGYQILWIEDRICPVEEILEGDRIDVMDKESFTDREVFDSEITTVISDDYGISRLLPCLGSVELLVMPTIATECALTNPRLNGQVSETLFKGVQPHEFRVRSSAHRR